MSGSDEERRHALTDLLDLRLPVGAAVDAVRSIPWDSEVELVSLDRASVLALLQRYLQDELTDADVEQWANAIEGRDDIGLEAGYEEPLRTFVYEAANPALVEPISKSAAYRWQHQLAEGPPPSSPADR
ncbi:MAG: hypothetical protein ABJA34_04200 [Pseudonocardiales bacterium]